MEWVLNNLSLIVSLTLDHMRLAVLPIIAGFVVSVPMGWLSVRFPRLGPLF